MCDVYTAQCESCGREVEVHIADFCTAEDNVRVFCPTVRCQHAAATAWEVCGKKVQRFHKAEYDGDPDVYTFLVDDEDAYGICVNQVLHPIGDKR